MTPKKRPLRETPTLTSVRARPAQQLVRVDPADEDRAVILGQLAELLAAHPRIGRRIAFKGGAIMHLVDGSARLSRDLDGSVVAGRPVRRVWVEQALSTPAARRVVVSVPRIVNENPSSLVFPVVTCRSLSRRGQATLGVSFSINWDDPLLDPPRMATVQLGSRAAQIPVLTARERAAEKVRTFLTRGQARDAYDLHHFGAHTLTATDRRRLPQLISRKLAGHVPDHWDLRARWDEQTDLAREAYERGEGLVVLRPKPPWNEVLHELQRFRTCLPRRAARGATDRGARGT